MFDRTRADFDGSIPEHLDEMPPGPALAAFLSAIDPETLVGHDRVVALRAHQRMASHHQAQMYRAMASVSDAYGYDDATTYGEQRIAAEGAAMEIAAALRLTRRSAETQIALALDLHRRLPVVFERLVKGLVDVPRARVLVEDTWHLREAAARDVVDRIIDDVPRYTTGQLRARLRKLCIATDPDDAADRFQTAVSDRRVVMEPTTNGTANLHGFDLPPDRVAAITDRVNRIARELRSARETRTMDQLRADVYLDLLEGRSAGHGAVTGVVDVTVDLTTLLRLDDHPGDLNGYGPVIADIARQVTEQRTRQRWTYTTVDPVTGLPVATGTIRRRPTSSQQRQVRATNRTCVFPGCRMPARHCDIDHTVRVADGGPTTSCNLAPLCEHHHTNRHRFDWTYRRLANHDHLWTSPLRHTHTTTGLPPPPPSDDAS